MNMLIPNSNSLPVPADNVHEGFPPAKKKKAAPVPPDNGVEPEVEDEDEEFEDEDESDEDEDAYAADDNDDADEEEPVEDDEEQSAQSATVKVTVTAAPNRPAAPAKAPAPKKAAPPPLPKKKKPSRPARGFAEAEMDAVVEGYIRPLREYTTKSGKHVEIHSPKWHRCVDKVKARGDVDNAYAVCTASLGAGKSLKKGHGGSA